MNKQQLANKIWASANKMRSKIEANEYKDYILGLIFYKFLSDNEVSRLKSDEVGMTDEDIKTMVEDHTDINQKEIIEYCRDTFGYYIEYKNLFSTWLDPERPFTVSDLRDALSAFDRLVSDNYKHVYAGIFNTLQAGLSKLGNGATEQTKALKDLINLIKDIPTDSRQDYDVLGFVYEYLISNFAASAGKKAGEFYTPYEVAQLMSEIVADHHKDKDRIEIYDPTSGSGSLLITIGKAVSKHMANTDGVKYYAQELMANTYNLTRMNLVMRGIQPANIITRNADSLARDWPIQTEGSSIGRPLYVDAVVSNPPYSQQWDPSEKELDPRFANYGVAPKTKADYAFLLHELHHIKSDGILTIVLPHGVLFRGKENDHSEGDIRKNLIENNNIDAIIGLPAGIFFGTGIPTLVMVLKKNRTNDDVLIIDASKGFVKAGKQNKLRACDIRRIADVVRERKTIEGFSRVVSREEIRKNSYNLNIPRYVDSSEPAIKYDIYATMFGGIPNSEISDLGNYWQALPSLRSELLAPEADRPYSTLKVENVETAIANNSDVVALKEKYNTAFNGFTETLCQKLIAEVETVKESKVLDEIADDIFSRLADVPLVDKYAAYQALSDNWTTIANDVETIQQEGIECARVVEPAYKIVKKDDEEVEVEDGMKGRIIPFEHVQKTYLSDELSALNALIAKQEEIESDMQSVMESLDPDEQEQLLNEDNTKFDTKRVKAAWTEILKEISTQETEVLDGYLLLSKKKDKEAYVIDNPCSSWDIMEMGKSGTYTATVIKKRIEDLKSMVEFEEETYEARIKKVVTCIDVNAELKKQISSAKIALLDHTMDKISNLTIEEIHEMLNLKWICPITSAIAELPISIINKLTDTVSALNAKYAVTYKEIEQSIVESEQNLATLIGQLTGDEFAISGLSNLIKK